MKKYEETVYDCLFIFKEEIFIQISVIINQQQEYLELIGFVSD